MRVHVLQHVAFEDIGNMATWLANRNAAMSYTRFYETSSLPELDDIDLIIAMGGPMSVNDEAELPWLKAEKQFIRTAIERGLPVIGICLGAQLIASALGARIYPNKNKEIGWFDIEATPTAANVFAFPPRATVFHWHGETFDLPRGAIRLAKSSGCENQAFQIGTNVIGLQFHLETTPESLDAIATNCGDELVEATYVQSETEIRAVPGAAYAGIANLMNNILDYVTANKN